MRRVGRPANTDPEETKRRVLDAAIELFGRYGEEGASVRQVARAADVSLSTVMHHFGSKDGLYRSCLDAVYEGLADLRDRFSAVLSESKSPREAIGDIVRASLRFCFERRNLLRVAIASAMATGRTPAQNFEKATVPTLAKVGGLMAGLTGRPVAEMRLLSMSVNHLVVRYALTDPAELAWIADPTRDPHAELEEVDEATFTALEEHLTALIIGVTFAARA